MSPPIKCDMSLISLVITKARYHKTKDIFVVVIHLKTNEGDFSNVINAF